MGVTFCWELIKAKPPKRFSAGSSSSVEALRKTFDDMISTDHIPMLRAMHLASCLERSLWGEMADTLERLQGDGHETISLRVWTEY